MENTKNKSKLKLILLILLFIFFIAMSFLAYGVLGIIADAPETDLNNMASAFDQTTSIYTEDGRLLENVEAVEYRRIVSIDDIPDNLINAIISVEDQRFYSHPGIDMRGILGSLVTNIKAGRIVRGGSTLTQQLVKNVYLTNQKVYDRKIKEAYLALRVESHLSKEQILEDYLNIINLGQGAYGVQAAAWTYFSKDVKDLNLNECTLLAAIAKSPVEYSPFKRYYKEDLKGDEEIFAQSEVAGELMYFVKNEKAFDRQKIVLKKMLELEMISKEEYDNALSADKDTILNPGKKIFHSLSSYSMDYISRDASKVLADYYNVDEEDAQHKFFTGGYQIYTSIDEGMQQKIEGMYSDFQNYFATGKLNFKIDDYNNVVDKNGGVIYINRWGFFDEDFNMILDGTNYKLTPAGDLLITKALFTKENDNYDLMDLHEEIDGKLHTYTVGTLNIPKEYLDSTEDYVKVKAEFIKDNEDFMEENEGVVKIASKYFQVDRHPTPQPQAASIVMENETGLVRAIVGGLDVKNSSRKIYNRALAPRSPGSAIKPLTVAAPYLEHGVVSDVVEDIPYIVDGEILYPNPYPGYKGRLTLRKALQYNSNSACVRFYESMKEEEIISFLEKLGYIHEDDNFVTKEENPLLNDENPDSLALGNMVRGLTLEELTQGYMALAREGKFIKPQSIVKIIDSKGETIYTRDTEENEIMSRENAYLVTSILMSNVKRGSAKGGKINNFQTAAAIGVNKFNSSVFVEGYTPYYTMGFYLGADSPKISLTSYEDEAIDFWLTMGNGVHESLPKKEFIMPDLERVYVCEKSGLLGTKLCEEREAGSLEYYVKGTVPTKYCDEHIELEICKDSDRLFGEDCPKDSKEEKIFFKRKNEYNKIDMKNILPDDYEFVPDMYCNIH